MRSRSDDCSAGSSGSPAAGSPISNRAPVASAVFSSGAGSHSNMNRRLVSSVAPLPDPSTAISTSSTTSSGWPFASVRTTSPTSRSPAAAREPTARTPRVISPYTWTPAKRTGTTKAELEDGPCRASWPPARSVAVRVAPSVCNAISIITGCSMNSREPVLADAGSRTCARATPACVTASPTMP
ncbi:Uncharacterised protein [Mycobacterium tuberculosis]|nr:Uncharacterised protein [Mycobacterium tuberculosis]CFE71341.1 Uncharacterised protein [Mycobacterium tuberculosis]CKS05726.1 Uncharacterised protein [Mycobacterium tuberculosis]CNM50240.1 Uncharacterised protein [Mycobacterium tuberculosis]CNM73642.1 Uncharacterised protein [Mycobacterium tuberculosis]